ncbi:hypothetical protein PIB30_033213 [Stylosanthes scabra]|uniref:Uncharacterized protein n=1 Tax=Stylosanthes scabra TaxID=79078 RepID=A0ABU6TE94_9FABA|nr:hypothetical protein [Stylosanthes scabra]
MRENKVSEEAPDVLIPYFSLCFADDVADGTQERQGPQLPTRFSKRLAALRACQGKDEAGPSNAAPHIDEIIEISSDSDSEQVPEYVPGEGAGIEEEEEEVPEYIPGEGALIEVLQPLNQVEPGDIPYDGLLNDPEDEPMEEEKEDPEEDLEEDPKEDPEEDSEEDPEENPGEGSEAMEQEDPREDPEEEPEEEQEEE